MEAAAVAWCIFGVVSSRHFDARLAPTTAHRNRQTNREKELATCGLRSRTYRFYGSSETERQAALRGLTSHRGGVLLTTYGMVLHNAEALAKGLGRIGDGGCLLGAFWGSCAFRPLWFWVPRGWEICVPGRICLTSLKRPLLPAFVNTGSEPPSTTDRHACMHPCRRGGGQGRGGGAAAAVGLHDTGRGAQGEGVRGAWRVDVLVMLGGGCEPSPMQPANTCHAANPPHHAPCNHPCNHSTPMQPITPHACMQIKNPSMQLAQRMRTLHARTRLIISGTPIQNNLSEMWALFDFAVPGLLGPLRQFKLEYEKPILQVPQLDPGLRHVGSSFGFVWVGVAACKGVWALFADRTQHQQHSLLP